MSRSLWRCRNRHCAIAHGAILGYLTTDGSLVLASDVRSVVVYFDTRRAAITCPACGVVRDFRGARLLTARSC